MTLHQGNTDVATMTNFSRANGKSQKSDVATSVSVSDNGRKNEGVKFPPPLVKTDPKLQPNTEEKIIKRLERPMSITVGQNRNSEDFTGIPKLCWLHLGRVNMNTNREQILDHLKKTFGRDDFVVEQLPKRDDAKSISFKIGADISLLSDVYAGDKWPENVTLRRYFFRGSNRAQWSN
ncbi:uncharacterized protein LOC123322179 [Coccinella septempunctata]|uniref:uncharacterized protein LOC123322179 n=1 Tax=Coccinella septempunctata TaxID=41139 RepID=UPI001D08032D|nr:uncharacterized protein LOC123322179 [Coccinella septempunctata]